MCGWVAIVTMIAKINPAAYVQCAIDLFSKGRAVLGQLVIEPNDLIKQHDPKGQVSQVDWLVLASVRNNIDDFSLLKKEPENFGATNMRELFYCLKGTGFRHVMFLPTLSSFYDSGPLFHGCDRGHPLLKDKGSSYIGPDGNMMVAAEFCSARWLVCVDLDANIIDEYGKNTAQDAGPRELPHRSVTRAKHAVWLKQAKFYENSRGYFMDLVLCSWGAKYKFQGVPVQELTRGWGGILVASDVDQFTANDLYREKGGT